MGFTSEDNTFEKHADEIAQGLQRATENEMIYELKRTTMISPSGRKTIHELTENVQSSSQKLINFESLFRRKLHNPDLSGITSLIYAFNSSYCHYYFLISYFCIIRKKLSFFVLYILYYIININRKVSYYTIVCIIFCRFVSTCVHKDIKTHIWRFRAQTFDLLISKTKKDRGEENLRYPRWNWWSKIIE